MRRRNLLGGGSIEYVFSAQSTSVSVGYYGLSTSVNITSTANGSNIGYSVVSYDGTVVTRVTTAATYIDIWYSTNPRYDDRNGNVVLKQNDSNKTITINIYQSTQSLKLGYGGILLDGTSGSIGSISFDSKGSNVSFRNVPSWANVTYSSGKINATATSTNSDRGGRTTDITVNVGSRSTKLAIIQLPSDYHSKDYVWIRSRNWAIKNVGASSVQDYGNYYQWGAGATTYENVDQYHTGGTDSTYTLPSSADTATQVMGSGWRMPTKSEMNDLTYTSYFWVSYNGVNGGTFFESGGSVLFFPAGGYYKDGINRYKNGYSDYWSSTPENSTQAWELSTYSSGKQIGRGYTRNYGFSVRGVHT